LKLATLLYIKNLKGEYLLIKRNNNPNKGLISPPGGKVKTDIPESPVSCAVREANEECKINSSTEDWQLIGIVTEKNYPNIGNLIIFCFEYKNTVDVLPPEMGEGNFVFIPSSDIYKYNLPETDKLYIWKFVLERKKSVFSIFIDCSDKNNIRGTIEQR